MWCLWQHRWMQRNWKSTGLTGGEDALDELPTLGTLELCWIHGELGRKREIRDRVSHGSGKHLFLKMEVNLEGAVYPNLETPKCLQAAVWQHFPVELKHMDDFQTTERETKASRVVASVASVSPATCTFVIISSSHTYLLRV